MKPAVTSSTSPASCDDFCKTSISKFKQKMLEAQSFDASITEDEDTVDLEDDDLDKVIISTDRITFRSVNEIKENDVSC